MFAPEKDALAAHRRRIKGGRRGKVLAYTTIPGKVKCNLGARAARYTRSPAMPALKDSVPRML
jgi:hypothetical protein